MKYSPYGTPTDFDTADKAIAAVKKSLARLGVAKIDFYHIWCLRKMANRCWEKQKEAK